MTIGTERFSISPSFFGENMSLLPLLLIAIGIAAALGTLNNFIIEKLSEDVVVSKYFKASIYLITLIGVVASFKYSDRMVADVLFATFLIIVGGIDHLTKSIVVVTIYIGVALFAGLSLYYGMPLLEVFIGGVIGFFLYLAIYLIAKLFYKREAFGFGDVMFMGAIGVFLGPWNTILAGLMTFYVALVFIVIQKLVGKLLSRQTEIAFAPYMAVSAWLVSLFGAQIVELYLTLFMV